MKKKILAAVLSLSTLIATQVSAYYDPDDPRVFLDKFNNDLFEVKAEIDLSKSPEKISHIPTDFFEFTTRIFQDETYKKCKMVRVNIDYEGNITTTDLTDFIDFDYRDETPLNYESSMEGVFNDGVAYTIRNEEIVDPNYPESYTVFKDINGNVLYEGYNWYHIYDYNLGIIRDSELQVDFDGKDYNYTTFKDIVSNKEYCFNCSIGLFNDDGYAIMDTAFDSGDENNKYYVVKLKKGIIPTVSYNGEKIKFDQIPVIENGRTLVPLRAIFEKIGADVEWDGDTQTITASKDNTEISLTIDNAEAVKNGEKVTLDVPAKIVNGRTLVPVRFVADCFGVDVQWDQTMQRVSLTSKTK
ncbi:MAG: copper amine oxidase N-terminal domain-containing protein [Clostridia bacterium]|nr:copper amine oxidase N-terminal domain-containing protein [Clostridia bacterium]